MNDHTFSIDWRAKYATLTSKMPIFQKRGWIFVERAWTIFFRSLYLDAAKQPYSSHYRTLFSTLRPENEEPWQTMEGRLTLRRIARLDEDAVVVTIDADAVKDRQESINLRKKKFYQLYVRIQQELVNMLLLPELRQCIPKRFHIQKEIDEIQGVGDLGTSERSLVKISHRIALEYDEDKKEALYDDLRATQFLLKKLSSKLTHLSNLEIQKRVITQFYELGWKKCQNWPEWQQQRLEASEASEATSTQHVQSSTNKNKKLIELERSYANLTEILIGQNQRTQKQLSDQLDQLAGKIAELENMMKTMSGDDKPLPEVVNFLRKLRTEQQAKLGKRNDLIEKKKEITELSDEIVTLIGTMKIQQEKIEKEETLEKLKAISDNVHILEETMLKMSESSEKDVMSKLGSFNTLFNTWGKYRLKKNMRMNDTTYSANTTMKIQQEKIETWQAISKMQTDHDNKAILQNEKEETLEKLKAISDNVHILEETMLKMSESSEKDVMSKLGSFNTLFNTWGKYMLKKNMRMNDTTYSANTMVKKLINNLFDRETGSFIPVYVHGREGVKFAFLVTDFTHQLDADSIGRLSKGVQGMDVELTLLHPSPEINALNWSKPGDWTENILDPKKLLLTKEKVKLQNIYFDYPLSYEDTYRKDRIREIFYCGDKSERWQTVTVENALLGTVPVPGTESEELEKRRFFTLNANQRRIYFFNPKTTELTDLQRKILDKLRILWTTSQLRINDEAVPANSALSRDSSISSQLESSDLSDHYDIFKQIKLPLSREIDLYAEKLFKLHHTDVQSLSVQNMLRV